MDQHSHTTMNLPTVASSSSTRRPCFVFGVELSAPSANVDNGNANMQVNNDARGEGKAVASDTVVLSSAKEVQLSERPSKGKEVMVGSASERKKAKATKKNDVWFPKDTKALLSTGIFDGLCVSYCYGETPREKDRRQFAMIKGNRYLCACMICMGQQYVSARKLEHHAGYETKHPNGNIFLGTGFSIFQAVEKLKKTPRNKLFDKIRSIAGSQMREGNFNKWKASYLAQLAENASKVQKNIHK